VKKNKKVEKQVKSQIPTEEKKIKKTTAWVEAAKKYKTEKNCSYKQALQDLKRK